MTKFTYAFIFQANMSSDHYTNMVSRLTATEDTSGLLTPAPFLLNALAIPSRESSYCVRSLPS